MEGVDLLYGWRLKGLSIRRWDMSSKLYQILPLYFPKNCGIA